MGLSDYIKLKYIEGNGWNRIDIPNVSMSNIVIRGKFEDRTPSTTSHCDFVYSEHGGYFIKPISIRLYKDPDTAQFYNGTTYEIPVNSRVVEFELDTINKKFNVNGNEVSISYNYDYTDVLYLLKGASSVSSARIYRFELLNNGVSILNMIPVKRISDNEVGMYDLVNDIFYPDNNGYGFTAGPVDMPDIGLYLGTNKTTLLMGNTVAPLKGKNKKYKLLDYIQSSGTQYLLTTLKPKGTEHFKISFIPLEWDTQNNNVICGARTSSNGIFVFGSISDQYGGGARLANYGYNANISKPTLNVEHTVEYINEKMYYDGTEYTATNRQIVQINSPMSIFAGNTDGAVQAHSKMKLTGYEEYDTNGNLTHNWVPAQRVSDSVIGMYDTVAHTFITNSGTGTFTYGSVVQDYIEEDVVQVEYVESNGNQFINTGIKGNEVYGFELDITPKAVKPGTSSIYLSYLASGPTLDNLTVGTFQNADGLFYRNRGAEAYKNAGAVVTQFRRHTISSLGNNFRLDGNVLANAIVLPCGSLAEDVRLLGSAAGTEGGGIPGSLYRGKIYSSNNVLVRDYLPVKVGSEYCLYDKISGEIFFNAGTGAFTGGNALPVTKIYLGSTRLQ